MAPRTQYTRSRDGLSIAYQVVGSGPVDLVYVPHVDLGDRGVLGATRRYARFFDAARLVHAADPVRPARQRACRTARRGAADARGADGRRARGHGRGRLRARRHIAICEGGAMAMLFAATAPRARPRARALRARSRARSCGRRLPVGLDRRGARGARSRLVARRLGRRARLATLAPSRADDAALPRLARPARAARHEPRRARRARSRSTATSTSATCCRRSACPTLVLHRSGDR